MARADAMLALCILAALPALLLCSTSSSSEEDGLDAQEAAVERCVRVATPNLIAGGTYEHLSKVDACVNDGLNGLEDGKAPSSMARQIVDCVGSKAFPEPLKPTVDGLKACTLAALP